MGKQLIISISREYGSGGRVIAQMIANEMGLPMYDRNLLDEIAKEKELDVENLKEFDEKPSNPLLTRRVRGYSNSMEEAVAEMQFDYLLEKAKSGESFVVVGRCSEWILREQKSLVSIFIVGDWEPRIHRIMDVYHVGRVEAVHKIKRHDWHRKNYHNAYADTKWGSPHSYDLLLSSSVHGIEGTVDVLKNYIEVRKKW